MERNSVDLSAGLLRGHGARTQFRTKYPVWLSGLGGNEALELLVA